MGAGMQRRGKERPQEGPRGEQGSLPAAASRPAARGASTAGAVPSAAEASPGQSAAARLRWRPCAGGQPEPHTCWSSGRSAGLHRCAATGASVLAGPTPAATHCGSPGSAAGAMAPIWERVSRGRNAAGVAAGATSPPEQPAPWRDCETRTPQAGPRRPPRPGPQHRAAWPLRGSRRKATGSA